MMFIETKFNGVFLIEPKKLEDERGFFARIWDKKIFESKGLNSKINQCSTSFNNKKGTFRGMHYQDSPYEEDKLVRCTKGAIFDVIVDFFITQIFKSYFSNITNNVMIVVVFYAY